jgi:hypothetical protein
LENSIMMIAVGIFVYGTAITGLLTGISYMLNLLLKKKDLM